MSSDPEQPSRRAIVRGAAWTTPVIAMVGAAPAYAISPRLCPGGRFTLDWSYGAGTFVSSPATPPFNSWTWSPFDLQGAGSFSVSAGAAYSAASPTSPSLTMRGTTFGVSNSGVAMGITNTTLPNDSGCFTFSFSQPLVNLQFYLGDIDWGNERVWITPTPTTATIVDPAIVAGSGTPADPWHSLVASDVDVTTSNHASVNITYASISSFTICLRDLTTGGAWQSNIFFSRFVFDCPAWV